MKDEYRSKARMAIFVPAAIVVEMAQIVWKFAVDIKRRIVHAFYVDRERHRSRREELIRQEKLGRALKKLKKKTEKELIQSEIKRRRELWR